MHYLLGLLVSSEARQPCTCQPSACQLCPQSVRRSVNISQMVTGPSHGSRIGAEMSPHGGGGSTEPTQDNRGVRYTRSTKTLWKRGTPQAPTAALPPACCTPRPTAAVDPGPLSPPWFRSTHHLRTGAAAMLPRLCPTQHNNEGQAQRPMLIQASLQAAAAASAPAHNTRSKPPCRCCCQLSAAAVYL